MISTIRLDRIESSAVARPLIAASIDALAESIGNIGLHPLTVMHLCQWHDSDRLNQRDKRVAPDVVEYIADCIGDLRDEIADAVAVK